jgi:4-hydroxy-tetrahydrodipicolinate reductase
VSDLKTVIAGVSGRMGRALLEAVAADAACVLHGALDRAGSTAAGQDAGIYSGTQSGVAITDQPAIALAGADVLVDFTRPEATLVYLEACRKAGVNLIIGTTGFDAAGKAAIAAAAKDIGIVFAPNFSVGVNLLMQLAETAAKVLSELPSGSATRILA